MNHLNLKSKLMFQGHRGRGVKSVVKKWLSPKKLEIMHLWWQVIFSYLPFNIIKATNIIFKNNFQITFWVYVPINPGVKLQGNLILQLAITQFRSNIFRQRGFTSKDLHGAINNKSENKENRKYSKITVAIIYNVSRNSNIYSSRTVL